VRSLQESGVSLSLKPDPDFSNSLARYNTTGLETTFSLQVYSSALRFGISTFHEQFFSRWNGNKREMGWFGQSINCNSIGALIA